MTLTSSSTTLHGLRAVKFRAVLNKSKKKGIPRRYQKTSSVKCVRADLEEWAMMISAKNEADRWEKKVMREIEEANKISDQIAAIPGVTEILL